MAGALGLSMANAHAQTPPSSACQFALAGTGKIRAIADGRSFTLTDGREIRLAGIEVPLPPRPGEDDAQAATAVAARAALASMLADAEVELRPTAAVPDRYGRLLAFVNVIGDGTMRSAAHGMLAKGFARVSAHVGERACAAELLAQERSARQSKLGLWSEPYYAIRGADSAPELLAERGRFTVAEGKIWSVRESGGTIYLNFGQRWTQALTVTVSKRHERDFAAAGLAPKVLENRRVRVRGWIEDRNGPRIDAEHPEQIELSERN